MVRDQALKDLANDLVTLRMQLGVVSATANAALAAHPQARSPRGALYTCDRVAVAQRALADVPTAQAALGEAESLCAYQAPLAAATERLDAPHAAIALADCASTRELIERVGPKYRADAAAVALFARYKTACPHTRLFGHAHAPPSTAASVAAPPVDHEACRHRCDDAASSCRSSCTRCYSCTTDKTQEWCTEQCNTCKQGCEQNESFCKTSCGG